jgi:hypothetical protein
MRVSKEQQQHSMLVVVLLLMWQMQVLCRQPMVPWVMMKQSVQGSRRQQMQGAQLLLLLLLTVIAICSPAGRMQQVVLILQIPLTLLILQVHLRTTPIHPEGVHLLPPPAPLLLLLLAGVQSQARAVHGARTL